MTKKKKKATDAVIQQPSGEPHNTFRRGVYDARVRRPTSSQMMAMVMMMVICRCRSEVPVLYNSRRIGSEIGPRLRYFDVSLCIAVRFDWRKVRLVMDRNLIVFN